MPVGAGSRAFQVQSLPQVAFPSPSPGTSTDGQVGRGLGESEGLHANKRGRE